MKITGITRIRNESLIINNTLNHVGNLVDDIVVYDDASTDDTVKICNSHSKVKKVFEGKQWLSSPQERQIAEGKYRQIPYDYAMENGSDWVYYFDADEYAEWNNVDFSKNINSYYFRLFDFYITKDDIDINYLDRKYMGGEYRDIPMLFKVNKNINFIDRVPRGFLHPIEMGGYVKHYGKAITIEQWNETCNYYINHRWKNTNQMLLNRWKNRIGKAIHTTSDFNTPLITWEDRTDKSKIIKIG